MEFINEHTIKSLDLEFVFDMISPRTPYGMHRKREIKPFRAGEEEFLKKDYAETELLLKFIEKFPGEFREIKNIFNEIKEIRTSIKRAAEGVVLDEVELFQIKNFILNIKDIYEIQKIVNEIPDSMLMSREIEIENLLDPENQNTRTFYLYDSYSEELRGLRQDKKDLQRKLDSERKKILAIIEESLGVKLKLSGEISILKKDEEKLNKARNCSYLAEGASTMLMSTFRLKNDDRLNELFEKLEKIKQNENSEEYSIRKYISSRIAGKAESIFCLTDKLGKLDFFMARAEFALSIGGNKPVLHCHEEINIKNGRHIKLESILSKRNMEFCPVSIDAPGGVTVITGANMGGKTVSLKLAGLLTAMVHYGLYVPAEEFRTCLFDYIYFSIGDMQSIDSGLSTFGSEISGMIEILKYSSLRGLILIDELARGTNPEEGCAISRAIVRKLKESRAVTLFTTHFDGITMEEGVRHLRVRGLKKLDFNKLHRELEGKSLGIEKILQFMDYTLENAENSYDVPRDAINIARLLGLDSEILDNALKIISEGKEDNDGKA